MTAPEPERRTRQRRGRVSQRWLLPNPYAPEAKRRFHIESRKNRLDRERIGRKLLQQIANQYVNGFQCRAYGFFADFIGYGERTIMQRTTAPAVRLHDTVARGSGGGGINAKHAKQKFTRSGFAHAKKCKARSHLVPLVCEARLFVPVAA